MTNEPQRTSAGRLFVCLFFFGEANQIKKQKSKGVSEVVAARTSGLVKPILHRLTGFPTASIRSLINRWSELSPLYQAHGYIGLGSKLYPSKMPRMRNKDLTRFMQSLSRVRESRANEKKAPLAGWGK